MKLKFLEIVVEHQDRTFVMSATAADDGPKLSYGEIIPGYKHHAGVDPERSQDPQIRLFPTVLRGTWKAVLNIFEKLEGVAAAMSAGAAITADLTRKVLAEPPKKKSS